MKNKQIEVYDFYKKLYPGSLLFFHVKNEYVVLSEDIVKIAELLHYETQPDELKWPDSEIMVFAQLGDLNQKIRIIECKNKDNVFDYPDIELIQKEKQDDY